VRKTTECIKRLGLNGVILSVPDCMKTFNLKASHFFNEHFYRFCAAESDVKFNRSRQAHVTVPLVLIARLSPLVLYE
jgi:hypothetical protein